MLLKGMKRYDGEVPAVGVVYMLHEGEQCPLQDCQVKVTPGMKVYGLPVEGRIEVVGTSCVEATREGQTFVVLAYRSSPAESPTDFVPLPEIGPDPVSEQELHSFRRMLEAAGVIARQEPDLGPEMDEEDAASFLEDDDAEEWENPLLFPDEALPQEPPAAMALEGPELPANPVEPPPPAKNEDDET